MNNKIIYLSENLEKREKAKSVYLKYDSTGVAPRVDRGGLAPSPVLVLIKPNTPRPVVLRELRKIEQFIVAEPDLLKMEPYLQWDDSWRSL